MAQDTHQHSQGPAEHVGNVHFPTSCTATAQRRFDVAVAYLHSFWYEKAGPAFKDVATADPSCAMAYWGQAMAILHPLWTPPAPADLAAALQAAERGLALAKTPRERDYLNAIRTYYKDYAAVDGKARLVAYEQAMEGVARRYLEDREAQIFYALALIAVGQANPTDTTFAYQKRADAILEPLFKLEPRHPGLAHYLIHTNDVPQLASLGLYAARRYAEIAPDVPHAQHMPSHIFTRLGLWEEDIASNTRSMAGARKFEAAQHLNGLWESRGHAMDYLVYAYLQEGRDADARSVVAEVAGVTAGDPPGSLINEYALAAIPVRYALERGRWDEAMALPVRPAPEWRATEAITHFARAIGAARSGDTTLLRAEMKALDDIEQALVAAGGPQAYWAHQVGIQVRAVAAWDALLTDHDTSGALGKAQAAADEEDRTQKHPVTPGAVVPARELYADLQLAVGQPGAAARAYATSLQNAPGRARSLFGLARAAELAGDLATARARYEEFLKLMEKGDGERPELRVARAFVASR
jgi:hypothetical protein